MGLLDEKAKLINETYIGVWKLIELLSNTNSYTEIGSYLGHINAQTSALKLYHLNSFYQITEVNPLYGMYVVIKDIIEKLIYDINDPSKEKEKIIEDIQLKAEKYYWKKADLAKFKELKDILFPTQKVEVLSIEQSAFSPFLSEVLKENKEKYSSFIYLIEDFCHTFDILIYELSSFLLLNKFESQAIAYIKISKVDCIPLDILNSTKAIYSILNILTDSKYNSTRFENSYDDELMYEFGHIHIEINSLYSFQPLKDLKVNICSGYEVFGSAKYGDLNIKDLNQALKNYRDSQPKAFSDEWYDMHPKLKELRDVTQQETLDTFSNPNLLDQHPALDINHPNHAPELKLAFEVWEEIYINGKYVESHSKSVEQLLSERGYEVRSVKTLELTNLAKRIIAITNKK
ncbi:hypothetical protein [Acinetobacter brisouii]